MKAARQIMQDPKYLSNSALRLHFIVLHFRRGHIVLQNSVKVFEVEVLRLGDIVLLCISYY